MKNFSFMSALEIALGVLLALVVASLLMPYLNKSTGGALAPELWGTKSYDGDTYEG